MTEKRENLGKLQIAFCQSGQDDEKEPIWLLYLCKGAADRNIVASVLHISQQAVNKRKQKHGEKLFGCSRVHQRLDDSMERFQATTESTDIPLLDILC